MPRRASTNLWFQKSRVRVWPERRASDVGPAAGVPVRRIEIQRTQKLELAPEPEPAVEAPPPPAAATKRDWTGALKVFTEYYIDHLICDPKEKANVPDDVDAFFTQKSKVWWQAIQHYMGLCTRKQKNPPSPAWKELKKLCNAWLKDLNPETSQLWNLLLALGTVYLQCTSKPQELDYWHYIHYKYLEQRQALSSQDKILNVNPEWVYMFRTFLDQHSAAKPEVQQLYRSLRMDQLRNDKLMSCMEALVRKRG